MRSRNFLLVPGYERDAASQLQWENDNASVVTGRVLWGIKAKGHSLSTANPKTLGQKNVSRYYSWVPGWRMIQARKNSVNATTTYLTFVGRLASDSGLKTTQNLYAILLKWAIQRSDSHIGSQEPLKALTPQVSILLASTSTPTGSIHAGQSAATAY